MVDLSKFDLRFEPAMQAMAQTLHDEFHMPWPSADAIHHLHVTPLGVHLQTDLPGLQQTQSVHHPQHLTEQLLDRAIACRPGDRVIDATAGFGFDAMHLARRRCQVMAIESHPVVHLLAKQQTHPNLTWVWAEVKSWLADNPPDPDTTILYLDPMFEAGRKASPKPNAWVQLLRHWQVPTGQTLLQELLPMAKRVVIKQPRHAPVQCSPHHQIKGKSIRFDVYQSA
ncbi:class I SAM-dependent methyltransferase [Gammaproteobacteria bacterium]|nr:class I SAM-dependent methyltransferase [Gammaproteobacteria bacterium]